MTTPINRHEELEIAGFSKRTPLQRCLLQPFETAFCFFVIVLGISGLAKFGLFAQQFNALVNGAVFFHSAFLMSGFLTLVGISGRVPRIELLGLCSLIGMMVARIVVVFQGTVPVSSIFSTVVFIIIFSLGAIARAVLVTLHAKELKNLNVKIE